jgi:hypothetical protein
MKIKITTDDLKEKKLFVATPMYGGQCAGMFTRSTNDLATHCANYGIECRFYYLFNESLITRARNYCVDEFLRSDCTHMLFIDSDIGFKVKDVFTLLHLCDSDNGMDVVTGPYPKKTIAWEKVSRAAAQGWGDDDPFKLEQFAADFVFNPASGVTSFKIDEPVQVQEGGTGFMMIDRRAFAKFDEAYPEQSYKPDHVRTANFDGTRDVMCYFDTVIDPESRRYLSEDYMFSQWLRKAGGKIWLCPWMQLQHVGAYIFQGSMAAMAAIQASPTADKSSRKKNYEPLTNNESPDKINRQQRKRRSKQKKAKKG